MIHAHVLVEILSEKILAAVADARLKYRDEVLLEGVKTPVGGEKRVMTSVEAHSWMNYLVRCEFTNRFGNPFWWTFQIDADDYAGAIRQAARIFFLGLTVSERIDACETVFIICWPEESLPEETQLKLISLHPEKKKTQHETSQRQQP